MRPFPPGFRRNLSFGVSPKNPGTPGAEALCGMRCSVIGNLSLFGFGLGQYECSMGIYPATGQKPSDNCRHHRCTRLQAMAMGQSLRVSSDLPGCGSDGWAFLRCRAMLSPWRARSRGCHAPWAVFLPYRPDGSPWSNFFYDRQGSPFRRFCRRPRLANTLVIMGVHIQKSTKSN